MVRELQHLTFINHQLIYVNLNCANHQFDVKFFVLMTTLINMFFLVQEYLKEEPYTAEQIEKITGEKLTSFLNINASYLDVIKAAKQYKLHQVRCSNPHY